MSRVINLDPSDCVKAREVHLMYLQSTHSGFRNIASSDIFCSHTGVTCADHGKGQGEDPAAGHLPREEHAGRDDAEPAVGHHLHHTIAAAGHNTGDTRGEAQGSHSSLCVTLMLSHP